MKDKQGREYARVDRVKRGVILECDGGFSCMAAGARRGVRSDANGLYIECDDGKHYLDGQLDFEGKPYYVGLYLIQS